MAPPIPYDFRKKVVRLRQSGKTFKFIAKAIGYSERSVKRIWYRFKKEGDPGLLTKYHLSGRRPKFDLSLYNKVGLLKDGDQGAPYIRSLLLVQHPIEDVPHERTIQRWWKGQGVNRPRGRPKSKSNWTQEPGHTWQIDGKGYIKMQNDQVVSWIKVADEATSSDLYTRLFSLFYSRSHSTRSSLSSN